ncbi:hypothetical protein ACFSIL_42360, partial [Streptosporangium lutulentum]
MSGDEWFGDLRAVRGCAHSTLRSYQDALRSFCRYVIDPAYDWSAVCEQRFGTHPIQVVHEWNTAAHVQESEAQPEKRAFTIDELQDFFDYADDQVTKARERGRKGWLPVQDRLQLRPATQRDPDAGCLRPWPQSARTRVRGPWPQNVDTSCHAASRTL